VFPPPVDGQAAALVCFYSLSLYHSQHTTASGQHRRAPAMSSDGRRGQPSREACFRAEPRNTRKARKRRNFTTCLQAGCLRYFIAICRNLSCFDSPKRVAFFIKWRRPPALFVSDAYAYAVHRTATTACGTCDQTPSFSFNNREKFGTSMNRDSTWGIFRRARSYTSACM
jgi:hypothetical protein